jgi:Cu-processing system permease protein
VLTEDRIRGLGIALAIWIAFAVVFDGVVLLAIYALRDFPVERPLMVLTLANPIDLARILLLLEFEVSALMGFTGALFRSFFGSEGGKLASALALTGWLVLPLAAGLRAFSRKNF